MKKSLVYCLLLFVTLAKAQQSLIHAHNDYAQPEPFINAYHNKVFSIEADVYAVENNLYVAHDKKDINRNKTLAALYLQPIIHLFATHNGRISEDTGYAPVLMIDIKENSTAVIPGLIKLLAPYRDVFDRTVNKHAVMIVLSGERGNISGWNKYPEYIFFGGRPYENCDSAALQRLAFISDSYMNYMTPKDSIDIKLQQLVADTHKRGKLLRLWAIPDDEAYWRKLHDMGVDIINTDKIAECRAYFSAGKH